MTNQTGPVVCDVMSVQRRGDQGAQQREEAHQRERSGNWNPSLVRNTHFLSIIRRQGRQRLYYLEGAKLRVIQEWLAPYERFWNERIANLEKLLAEEKHD